MQHRWILVAPLVALVAPDARASPDAPPGAVEPEVEAPEASAPATTRHRSTLRRSSRSTSETPDALNAAIELANSAISRAPPSSFSSSLKTTLLHTPPTTRVIAYHGRPRTEPRLLETAVDAEPGFAGRSPLALSCAKMILHPRRYVARRSRERRARGSAVELLIDLHAVTRRRRSALALDPGRRRQPRRLLCAAVAGTNSPST